MFHFMTAVTRAQMAGDKPAERDMSDKRRLSPRKKDRANNTKPARTRDGATHPGGRTMRRVLATLSGRQNNALKDGRAPGSRHP